MSTHHFFSVNNVKKIHLLISFSQIIKVRTCLEIFSIYIPDILAINAFPQRKHGILYNEGKSNYAV